MSEQAISRSTAEARPSPGAGRRRASWLDERVILGGGFPILILVVWEVASRLEWVNPVLFSSPTNVAKAAYDFLATGELWRHLQGSGMEFIVGLGVSLALGIPIGLLMGRYLKVEYALEPLVMALYTAPVAALYPLIILWFGISFKAMLLIIVLFSLFPVVVNTALGVRLVDPVLLRAAKSFGANERQIYFKIVLPAAVPAIMAGVRLAVGRALVGLVVAELFIGSEGLGYLIGYSASQLRMSGVFFAILSIGIIGVSSAKAFDALERRVNRWRHDTGVLA